MTNVTIALILKIVKDGKREPLLCEWSQSTGKFLPLEIDDSLVTVSAKRFVEKSFQGRFVEVDPERILVVPGVRKILDSLRFGVRDNIELDENFVLTDSSSSILTAILYKETSTSDYQLLDPWYSFILIHNIQSDSIDLLDFSVRPYEQALDNFFYGANGTRLYCSDEEGVLEIDAKSKKLLRTLKNINTPLTSLNDGDLLGFAEANSQAIKIFPVSSFSPLNIPKLWRVYSCFKLGDSEYLISAKVADMEPEVIKMHILFLDFTNHECRILCGVPGVGSIVGARVLRGDRDVQRNTQ